MAGAAGEHRVLQTSAALPWHRHPEPEAPTGTAGGTVTTVTAQYLALGGQPSKWRVPRVSLQRETLYHKSKNVVPVGMPVGGEGRGVVDSADLQTILGPISSDEKIDLQTA